MYSGFGAWNPNVPGCGNTSADIKWTQTALNALGFNAGVVDGIMGPQTAAAFAAYVASKAGSGVLGSCETLKADYDAKRGAGPAPGPGGQPAGTQCPQGQTSIFGVCVPNPFATQPAQPGQQPGQPGVPGITWPGQTPPPAYPPAGETWQKKPGMTSNQKLAIVGIVVALGVVGAGIYFGGKKKPAGGGFPATERMPATMKSATPNRRRRNRKKV